MVPCVSGRRPPQSSSPLHLPDRLGGSAGPSVQQIPPVGWEGSSAPAWLSLPLITPVGQKHETKGKESSSGRQSLLVV